MALLDGRMCHDPVGDCVCHDLARGRELQRWPEHQSRMSDRWLGQPPPVNNNITRHFLAAEHIVGVVMIIKGLTIDTFVIYAKFDYLSYSL